MNNIREQIKDKKKIVVKIGSSSLQHTETGDLDYIRLEKLVRELGQARLMMAYQKLFSEYNHVAAQILMTKNTIVDNLNRYNAHNTFTQLLKMGVIPIVNENDTVATYEIEIGDNDTLSAIVAALIDADLLISTDSIPMIPDRIRMQNLSNKWMNLRMNS